MTPTTRRKSTIAVTGVSLAGLMAFGTWLAQTLSATRASQQAAATVEAVDRYVTVERWRNDSTRRDAQFLQLLDEVRDLRTDNAQRLREICVALRAGCR